MNNMVKIYEIEYCGSIIDDYSKKFIETWHYSHSARSQKARHVFKLLLKSTRELVGVAIFGDPMSKSYNNLPIIELRRLCLIDETRRNAESFFLGAVLRWLRKNTSYHQVVTFADPNHGHVGTIYKASNFKYDGLENNGNPRIVQYGEKQIHLRQMYQKKGDDYSEDAKRIQALVESGEAQVLKQERKYRYIYELR